VKRKRFAAGFGFAAKLQSERTVNPVSHEATDTDEAFSETAPQAVSDRIGLALSGGGIRAAVFHLGVLRRLAFERLLERISVISTVSGGSLITAAIFSQAGMKWPSSDDYLESVYPELRRRITASDLFSLKSIGWAGLAEFNLRITH
jgi:NTE family protein